MYELKEKYHFNRLLWTFRIIPTRLKSKYILDRMDCPAKAFERATNLCLMASEPWDSHHPVPNEHPLQQIRDGTSGQIACAILGK